MTSLKKKDFCVLEPLGGITDSGSAQATTPSQDTVSDLANRQPLSGLANLNVPVSSVSRNTKEAMGQTQPVFPRIEKFQRT